MADDDKKVDNADAKATKAEPGVKAARAEEAKQRIDNEGIADIGLDRRKDHEEAMAGRQAQEQIEAEVARAEEMREKRGKV